MKKGEDLFNLVFTNSGVGLAVVNSQGHPYKTNRAIQEMLGYTGEELANMSFGEFTHPDDLEKDVVQFNQLVKGEILNYTMEKRYITKKGDTIWGLLNVALIKDEDGNSTDEAIGMVQDITQRKEAELKLEQTNRQLEQFAYLCTHDLKQPLSNIEGFLDLLKDEIGSSLNKDGKEYLNLINQSTELLKQKLEVILEYSSIGAEGDKEIISFKETLSEVETELKDLIKEKEAYIVNQGDVDLIKAFPEEFRVLVKHLISNALTFSSADRKPEIYIKSQKVANEVSISIEDNGVGFEMEYADRIFQIFQQLQEKSIYNGLGVGLACCKKIVEHHGGKINCKSVKGKGTIFTFSLPN
ncbi:sensor histidine kinase [Luteibaculum oceani]|nr:HAMP domain-containing sensor histidine kinase [Luteibaculum oceani]